MTRRLFATLLLGRIRKRCPEPGPEDLIRLISLNLGEAKSNNCAISLDLGPAAGPCQAYTIDLQLTTTETRPVVSLGLATVDEYTPDIDLMDF